MNLNIDKFGGKSIVPVRCGSEMGSAFFIADKYLLTATHVVEEAIESNAKIEIKINHETWEPCSIACKLKPEMGVSDVTLLNYLGKSEHDSLELLASSFHEGENLKIIGYPQEIGNGFDYFGLDIRAIRKIDDATAMEAELSYDVVAVRNDLLNLFSYGGFSGAPVLNEFEKVVGVASDQHFNSLSFTSIKKISQNLNAIVNLIEDDDCYDPTQYGNGYAHKHLTQKLNQAGARYSSNFHIPNEEFEKRLSAFCCINTQSIKNEIFSSFNNLVGRLDNATREFLTRESIGENENPFINYNEDNREIEELMPVRIVHLLDLLEKDKTTRKIKNPDRANWKKLHTFMEDYLEYKDLEKGNFVAISARAGRGKTHSICKFVDDNRYCAQFYLFFGNDFKDNTPENIILEQLGWNNEAFKELNEKLTTKNKYAIFVIDGINEGAGYHYWIDHIESLLRKFKGLNQLKLIISFREMNESDELRQKFEQGALSIDLGGFQNPKDAIQKYLEKYDIHLKTDELMKHQEFSTPLYLKLFCETYNFLTISSEYPTRDIIYRTYLRQKNIHVCRKVDENPNKDITNSMIDYLVSQSVNNYNLGDVPFKKAEKKANRIAPYRTWSKNLLHVLFQENILKEYNLMGEDSSLIGFEFDSIGDYLKMKKLIEASPSKSLKSIVYDIHDKLIDSRRRPYWPTYRNVLYYIFTDNKFDKDTLLEFIKKEDLKYCFIACLPEMHMDKEYSVTVGEVLNSIMDEDCRLSSPQKILYNLDKYNNDLVMSIHRRLSDYRMAERDQLWTTEVNQLSAHPYTINRLMWHLEDTANITKLILVIGWMLTTTAIDFRAKLIKVLREVFRKDSMESNISEAFEAFKSIDDPYILQGLSAAAYAALVLERNVQATCNIAEYILKNFYSDKENAPTDLIVRNWTMKIVELAEILNPEYTGWKKLKEMMPFQSVKNPFENLPTELFAPEYFGSSQGARELYTSLFAWDFARYVIGTNNGRYSRIFHFIEKGNNDGSAMEDDKNGVPLVLIQNAIANLIKEEYRYTDSIGKFDSSNGFSSRHHNSIERIGKKYQWVGLYKVLCYLSDNCYLTVDRWSLSERIAEYNFPWLTEYIPHTDPTLTIEEQLSEVSENLFDKIENDIFENINKDNWNSKEMMPTMLFVIKDKKDDEWVVLRAFDTQDFYQNNIRHAASVWYNSVIVPSDDKDKFIDWCKKDANIRQDFYSSGDYKYMWNDYPFANAYKEQSYQLNMKEDWRTECDVFLSVDAQLQEHFEGSNNEYEFLASAYSPNPDMMKELNLYNAERGIIRDEEGTIVAINMNPTYSRMSGIVIRKNYLDEYLRSKGLTLFYMMLVNKQSVAFDYKLEKDISLESIKEYSPEDMDHSYIKDIMKFDTYLQNYEEREKSEKTYSKFSPNDLEVSDLFEQILRDLLNSNGKSSNAK